MARKKDTFPLVIASTTATQTLHNDGTIRAIVLVVPTFSISTGGNVALTFAETGKTITRSDEGGSFIDDGFLVGQTITTTADVNTGPFTVVDVAELVLTVVETLTDEGPVSKTVSVSAATEVHQLEVLDEDGIALYSSTTGWAEGATHLIGSLAIPCEKGYTVKATLDTYCESVKNLTIATYIET